MQHADVAMYVGKKKKSDVTVYSSKLDKNSPHKLILMSDLRYAIENNELLLYYQPQVDMKENKVVGRTPIAAQLRAPPILNS